MTNTAPQPDPASAEAPRKHTQRFRRAANAIVLDPNQRRRQATAMQVGWSVLGDRDALLAFFNTHSPELDGRPLDIAVNSDEGMARVEAVLRAQVR